MVETRTIVEAIYYLLKKIGPTDKIKIVKLLYLADKFHLIKYGRTITNDDYWAMEHGPVGSNIKDVLGYDKSLGVSGAESAYIKKFFSKTDNQFKAKKVDKNVSLNFLSETDIEALDLIIKNFGTMKKWELRDFTHKYPEWLQYEEMLKNNETKREKIHTEELISTIPEDHFGFTNEDIENAKDNFSGIY